MESQTSQSQEKRPPQAIDPALSSCQKKTSESASFLADVRDHIDEFIHASMDEHKTCFQKTIKKENGEQTLLDGETIAAHFEALMFEDKELILSGEAEDEMVIEEKDGDGNEVPLEKMMKML